MGENISINAIKKACNHTIGYKYERFEPDVLISISDIKEYQWSECLNEIILFDFCPDCGTNLRCMEILTKDGHSLRQGDSAEKSINPKESHYSLEAMVGKRFIGVIEKYTQWKHGRGMLPIPRHGRCCTCNRCDRVREHNAIESEVERIA